MTTVSETLTIGFAYDPPVEMGAAAGIETVAAEYEDAQTIAWLRAALQEVGTVVDLPWGADIVARFARLDLDVIFNITEADGGRDRESLIPALAQARAIPCTGSDAVGLGISLDKYLTKVLAHHVGVPTPAFVKIDDLDAWEAQQPRLGDLRYPLFAKPNHGGTSMGIRPFSKVATPGELYRTAAWVLEHFDDSVLVEEFVAGREFTVGILAAPEPVTLPLAEIRLGDGSPDAFFAYAEKNVPNKDEVICPAAAPGEAAGLMATYARRIFDVLECRDLARIDFRVGADGIPYFLEINPLPGLSPYYSTFPAQAQAAGISPKEVVHRLVRNALARGPHII
jgi:D-alanine-D-alanine ligase